MQQNLAKFSAAGLRVAAISVDEPDASREWARRSGFGFSVLSDANLETIRKYDVAVEGEGIARPAEFLVDSNGIVTWRNLTDDYYVRARPDMVLEAARALR
jgi:peroxiredoxin